MEIPFYIVSALWLFTIIMWQLEKISYHKRAHAEQMEYLKLVKASSVAEFNATHAAAPNTGNPLLANIKKAYLNQAEESIAERDE